jgi:hypothetical protein
MNVRGNVTTRERSESFGRERVWVQPHSLDALARLRLLEHLHQRLLRRRLLRRGLHVRRRRRLAGRLAFTQTYLLLLVLGEQVRHLLARPSGLDASAPVASPHPAIVPMISSRSLATPCLASLSPPRTGRRRRPAGDEQSAACTQLECACPLHRRGRAAQPVSYMNFAQRRLRLGQLGPRVRSNNPPQHRSSGWPRTVPMVEGTPGIAPCIPETPAAASCERRLARAPIAFKLRIPLGGGKEASVYACVRCMSDAHNPVPHAVHARYDAVRHRTNSSAAPSRKRADRAPTGRTRLHQGDGSTQRSHPPAPLLWMTFARHRHCVTRQLV